MTRTTSRQRRRPRRRRRRRRRRRQRRRSRRGRLRRKRQHRSRQCRAICVGPVTAARQLQVRATTHLLVRSTLLRGHRVGGACPPLHTSPQILAPRRGHRRCQQPRQRRRPIHASEHRACVGARHFQVSACRAPRKILHQGFATVGNFAARRHFRVRSEGCHRC